MSRRNFIPRSATISSGLLDLLSHSALPKYGCLRSRRLAFPYRRSFFGNPRYASSTSTESLPRVAQPALWRPLIPKFLRRTQPSAASTAQAAKSRPSKEWNPATFYIVIFILIGSQAVQIIAIRNELNTYTRKADAKISLLKDVIERVQRGEDVDVEGLLGTGDKEKENEWEEVLREIEEEDALWQKKSRRRKESASTEDPLKRDTVPGLSEAVRGGRNEANGDPGNGTQSSRRRTGPSHGFY